MADELKHKSVGTELTQAEWEANGAHVFDSQATGDIGYASSATQLTRLGIGSVPCVPYRHAGTGTLPARIPSVGIARGRSTLDALGASWNDIA